MFSIGPPSLPTCSDVALFPTHAASGVIFRRIKPDALFPGLHQLRDSSARQHVYLEFAAVQLFAKMLA